MRSVFQFRDTLIQEYASFSRSFTRILAVTLPAMSRRSISGRVTGRNH